MPALRYERHTLCQTRSAGQWPGAADTFAVGRLSKAGGRESFGIRYAHDGHADTGVSADFTGSDPSAKDYGTELAHQISADAGAFRVLLWLASPPDVCSFRPLL